MSILQDKQRGVKRGAGAAMLCTLLLLGGGWALGPALPHPGEVLEARLGYVLSFDLLIIAALMLCVMRLANWRFAHVQDIDGAGLSGASAGARVRQAVIQNTLEQAALAIPLHLAGALLLPPARLPMVAAAALAFACGRAAFIWGYERGAPGRAFGFGLTAYPSFLLLPVLAALALLN